MLGRSLMVVLGVMLLFIPASSEKVEVGVYEVNENSTFSVPVIAKNLTNIAGFDISLQYDPNVVQFVSYSIGSEVGQNFHFDNVDNTNGNARFIIVVNKAISSDNVTVVILNFRAIGTSGSQSELRLYAELSRVIQGEQTSFQTITPECVSGSVHIKSQLQTEPSKTPTLDNSPVSESGGGHVDVTTPSPMQTPTSTPTPVNTSTPEIENTSQNESGEPPINRSIHESRESGSLENGHTEIEKPAVTPTAKMNNTWNETDTQNGSGISVRGTPTSEESTKTQGKSVWPIPGFETTLSIVLIFAVGFTLRRK